MLFSPKLAIRYSLFAILTRYSLFAILLVAARCSLIAASDSVQFTTSNVFTVPSNVTQISIEAYGAGGNGGPNGGGGGGGGGYASGVYDVVPGAEIVVTVGSSGGDATIVGSFLTAAGGRNGTLSSGGSGGVGTGGTLRNGTGGTGGFGVEDNGGGGGGGAAGAIQNGQHGFNCPTPNPCLNVGGNGGAGGGGIAGQGGAGGGYDFFLCDNPQPAQSGRPYGSGGGGGGSGNNSAPGLGAQGYVKITWDIPSRVEEEDLRLTNAEMWICVIDWKRGAADVAVFDLTGCKVAQSSTLTAGTYVITLMKEGAVVKSGLHMQY